MAVKVFDSVLRALHLRSEERDPFIALHDNAPWDDEPLTPEDEAAIEEGMQDIRAGRTISLEEFKRELGL